MMERPSILLPMPMIAPPITVGESTLPGGRSWLPAVSPPPGVPLWPDVGALESDEPAWPDGGAAPVPLPDVAVPLCEAPVAAVVPVPAAAPAAVVPDAPGVLCAGNCIFVLGLRLPTSWPAGPT